MLAVILCSLIITLAQAQGEDREARLVHTAQGPVRGYRQPDDDLFIFYSIPYATAPTGEDRFKAPLPAPTWITPFEAVDKAIICPQTDLVVPKTKKYVQEDCLMANVYVPVTEETNLPVLVYIHGGGFQLGHGDMMTPKNLVRSKKVIAVTFNYRLGAHGFLCLGTEGAPGNAGMKDQVALLRWVNKNIASFGGSPDDVTVAGFSSGSMAVDLLQFSKTTKGLFNKVIPESGSNLGVATVQLNPLQNAKDFASYLNFTNVDDVYALEEFYKTIPFKILNTLQFSELPNATVYFTPCVERDMGEDTFLKDAPASILKDGDYNKIPMLYGFANMEGLLHMQRFSDWKNKMNEKFSDFLPADLQFESDDLKEEVARQVKEFYFGDKPVDDKTVVGYINYFTDTAFAYPTLRSMKLQVEAGNDNIYLYEYSFTDDELPSSFESEILADVRGAEHCAQTMAVLDGIYPSTDDDDESNFPERFRNMKAVMRELWSNFITTGVPVPAGSALPVWPAAGADGAPHMSLNESLSLRGALLRERTRLWEPIYERHYRGPIPPPPPPQRKSVVHAQSEAARVVHTAQGPVRGYRAPGHDLFVFYGIPYATAPTGEDRFKAPLPAPVWITPFDAVDKEIICPQTDFMYPITNKNIQEDCLIANVYIPDTEETNLPVLVYVHGGAYQVGYGEMITPKNLVRSKKVIAVTFNYRLGAHGFLCLGTAGAPGNAGMKDQVTLLRWVNKNIASFGGNPNDVTIAGYSAGSSSVDLLQLSKSANGLFHKVIPESGANVAVWSVQIDPLQNAKDFAKYLNFTEVDDLYALEEFYKTIPLKLINSGPYLHLPESVIHFTPCVERDTGVERFLEDAPVNILRNGKYNKLPMLYGFADMEGLLRVQAFNEFKDKMNEKFSDFLPADLEFDSDEQKEELAKKIKEFYFGGKLVSDETIVGYVNYFTDVIFAYPMLRSVKLQVEAGNTEIYLYEYSFTDDDLPPAYGSNERPDVQGAYHCAQTVAVLDGLVNIADESDLPERFRKMKAVMRELWLNFITTGTPVPVGSALPAWPAVGADGAPHMSLNASLSLRGALLRERTRLWDRVYARHYSAPAPPPTPDSKHTEL